MFIRNILSVVVAIAACSSITPADASAASPSLTANNFESTIANGATFVKFYSPDCPHSQKLAPTWEWLAIEHKDWERTKGFKFAEVDCLAQGDLCEDYDIVTYPTMQLFYKGKTVTRFNKRRTNEALTEFVAAQAAEYINAPANLDRKEVGEVKVNALGKVVVLDEESYDRRTEFGPWLVEYYAPWCGHCRALAPIYEELAVALKGKVNVAKVDCTVNESICRKHPIRGFPTIYMQQHGVAIEYNGHRVLQPMIDFSLGAIASSVKPATAADFENIRSRQDVSFVYSYDANTKPEVTAAIEKQSQVFYEQINLHSTADPELINQLSVSVPSLVVLKDNRQYNYEGSLADDAALNKWISEVNTPLVITMGSHNVGSILGRPGWLALGIFEPEGEATPAARRELIETAYKYQQIARDTPLHFAILDAATWMSYVRGALKLEAENLPAVVLLNSREELHVPFGLDGRRVPIETEALLKYIDEYETGILVPQSMLTSIQKGFRYVQGRAQILMHFARQYPMLSGFTACAFILAIMRRLSNKVSALEAAEVEAEQKKRD
ncbi:hypothetical protein BG006_007123 [Podila minutissima]|uniref:Thioredoxin domain-containing protein n=1 Tax=Podila minutissima TaxID=64525 RepID=A0A9P5SIA1_9FUNG|nr:hypothetical protein BG006_007123 [Podila minutissima]